MNKTRKIILAVLLMFGGMVILGGCSHLEKGTSQLDQTLIGSWKLRSIGDTPATTLTFREDRTFQVDIGGDETVDIAGTYSIYGNRLKLTDSEFRGTTDCFHSGFYDYTVKDGKLTFEVFAEECIPRREILNKTWESNPLLPKSALP